MSELAPIALFVHKRPQHTRKALEALSQCPEAQRSDLIVFSDGPRDETQRPAVEETREVVRSAQGFRSVRLVEQKENLGLSRSIRSGVGEVLSRSEQVIVLEDDVEVTHDFLGFMNEALFHYAPRADIYSISGYLYPVSLDTGFPHDTFFFSRFSCWGWATWRDRWSKMDWSVPDRTTFLCSPEFWQMWRASNDLPELMLDLADGKNDSWAVLFNKVQIQSNGFSVHPVRSLARNTGFDGTGTHAGRKPHAMVTTTPGLGKHGDYRFAEAYDETFVEPLRRYFAHRMRRKLKNLFIYGRYF